MSPDDLYGLDPILRHALILGGVGLVTVIAYSIDAWWWRPSRREARARKWAERHVSSYHDQWLIPFQHLALVNRRIAAVGGFLSLVVLIEIPLGGQAYAAWLLAVPALVSILCGISATRVSLAPGTRVARLRELEIADYLPERTRWFMWVAGVVGCVACLLVAVTRGEWLLGISGSLMLVAPASVELAARRLARMPEPAQSAAHLYLQDVLRADHIRWAALSSALSSAMLCNWLSSAVDGPGWLVGTLMVMNVALLAGLCLVTFKPDVKASTYMRSRLWPQLRPGQLVSDDAPLPAAAVVS